MLGLITDRTERNVYRRNELSAKGWAGMTTAERAEWLGDPLTTDGANLLPPGPTYSSSVEVKFRNREIVATATQAGTYLYAVSIIGDAINYENKVLTLSIGSVTAVGGTPQIALYWHSNNGYEYAGASLATAGSMTFSTIDFPNTGRRANLAAYIYVTTAQSVNVGTSVRFGDVMLETGATPHPFVPYTEIVATNATKGAYNYSDLNRVERAVAEISDKAGLGLVTKTNWTMWDIPTESEMSRYLGNLRTLQMRYNIGIPLPDTMSGLHYESANDIEKLILETYQKVR